MNLETIEAIRQGITEIARQAETGWHGDDFNVGATIMHQRIDNYLCELIVENGGEVKEPEVFRYFEVRTFGNPMQKIVHRENEYGGGAYFWERRIKELEKKVNNPGLFVDVFEYDTEQQLIDYFLKNDKEPGQEIQWAFFEDWVQFVSMDKDGAWWKYEFEPKLNERDRDWWSDKGQKRLIQLNIIPFTAPDWRTSLRQRPKTTDQ